MVPTGFVEISGPVQTGYAQRSKASAAPSDEVNAATTKKKHSDLVLGTSHDGKNHFGVCVCSLDVQRYSKAETAYRGAPAAVFLGGCSGSSGGFGQFPHRA